MFAMASALRSFIGSSLRVASWYSLDVKEEAGRAASVGNMRALSNMLDAAELKAREQAAVAKRVTGVVPLEAAISYQRARSSRDGDLDDKLGALKDFWFSSAASQIAVLMARREPRAAAEGMP